MTQIYLAVKYLTPFICFVIYNMFLKTQVIEVDHSDDEDDVTDVTTMATDDSGAVAKASGGVAKKKDKKRKHHPAQAQPRKSRFSPADEVATNEKQERMAGPSATGIRLTQYHSIFCFQ